MTALLRGILFCLFLGAWAAVSPAAPPVDFQSSRLLVLGQAASEAARSAPMSVNPADDASAVPFAKSEPFGDACGCDGGMACGSCSDCAPVWTFRAGAVILDRSKPEDDVIARPAGGLLTVSAGGDFDFDWAGGVDIYVARQSACGPGLEFRFFNVDSNADFNYGDTGNLDIADSSVLSLFDVDAAYRSQLYSTEVNLRMPTSRRLTWLAGFRWIELQENLNYDIDLLSLVSNDFKWNTNNHLYGGQLGLDLQLWDLGSRLKINSVLKAGVYGNDAENDFHFRINNFSVLHDGASTSDVAFVGDIGINLSYQLTRHIAVMGGYQLLWMNGVALASDQAALALDRLDVGTITTQGDLFYHGALTGVVVSW